MVKATEKAILIINGQNFEDWETVSVRHELHGAPPFTCRFTCSEEVPISKNFGKMQIKPGDTCTVTLAGILAFSGSVATRQVFYDAHRHHIEIMCVDPTEETIKSSVVSKTGEWKDKTFKQIGDELLGRLGIRMTFVGGAAPSFKFPRASSMPGESVYDFLDSLARGLSAAGGDGIAFTSNPQGDFVVAMGPEAGGDSVIEGINILIGREIIYRPITTAPQLPATGQIPGNDEVHGPKAAHEPYHSEKQQTPFQGSGKSGEAVVVSEMPGWPDLLKGRGRSESLWTAADQITVIATVYGWIKPTGGLWKVNQIVSVVSPMLMMRGDEQLKARAVTFTQDNNTGTRTTLELMNTAAMQQNNPQMQ